MTLPIEIFSLVVIINNLEHSETSIGSSQIREWDGFISATADGGCIIYHFIYSVVARIGAAKRLICRQDTCTELWIAYSTSRVLVLVCSSSYTVLHSVGPWLNEVVVIFSELQSYWRVFVAIVYIGYWQWWVFHVPCTVWFMKCSLGIPYGQARLLTLIVILIGSVVRIQIDGPQSSRLLLRC